MEYIRLCFFGLLLNLNSNQIICLQPTTNCECGIQSVPLNNRIVGGSPTEAFEYPWLVEITVNNSLYCGGSLINNRYVLTAGHCVEGINPTNLEVILGRHNRRTKDGFKSKVETIILHENFTTYESYDENDIALIKLQENVRYNNAISPVCLPHPSSKYGGLAAFVIGWGRIYPNMKKTSNKVLRGNVQVLHDYKCKKSPIGFGYKPGNICAYRENVDACQGDSGSPLLYKTPRDKHEIIGVVSWGLDCATKNNPGVYARVPHFVRWILNYTKDSSYCGV